MFDLTADGLTGLRFRMRDMTAFVSGGERRNAHASTLFRCERGEKGGRSVRARRPETVENMCFGIA